MNVLEGWKYFNLQYLECPNEPDILVNVNTKDVWIKIGDQLFQIDRLNSPVYIGIGDRRVIATQLDMPFHEYEVSYLNQHGVYQTILILRPVLDDEENENELEKSFFERARALQKILRES